LNRFNNPTWHNSNKHINLQHILSIINQLDLLYFDKKDIYDDFNEFKDLDGNQLNKLLIKRLEKVEANFVDARIFIFIDSIDQLNSNDLNLNWF
jgi:hypothetical protein